MAEKKYYWLKLHKDFFRQKEIKRLRRIAGGDVYTIIYLKMLLQSLETDGFIFYDGYYDTFIEELADDIDEDPENVKVVVAFLMNNGLMEERTEDTYLLTKCSEMTGSESGSASRVRKHRALQCNGQALQCNNEVTDSNGDVTNCNTEIEKEKDIEKEKETDNKLSISQKQIDEDFEELWAAYPKKQGKAAAQKKYTSLIKAHKTTKEIVADGIKRYNEYIAKTTRHSDYIKNGSTWFNQECWNDIYDVQGGSDGNFDPRNQRWNDDDPTVI